MAAGGTEVMINIKYGSTISVCPLMPFRLLFLICQAQSRQTPFYHRWEIIVVLCTISMYQKTCMRPIQRLFWLIILGYSVCDSQQWLSIKVMIAHWKTDGGHIWLCLPSTLLYLPCHGPVGSVLWTFFLEDWGSSVHLHTIFFACSVGLFTSTDFTLVVTALKDGGSI